MAWISYEVEEPAPPQRMLALACVTVACLLAAGCVRRRLTVRTFPPGAQVFVDNQEIGTTPCSASYVYYGTRTITVMKDGYRTETIHQKLYPPWYEIPPLDFVTENLIPREIRDERTIDVQLVPEQIVPQQKLLERAQSLRDSTRGGFVTPLINLPDGASGPIHEPPPNHGVPGQGLPGGRPLPYEPLPPPGASEPQLPGAASPAPQGPRLETTPFPLPPARP